MATIAVDTGFSFTKVKTNGPGSEFRFPSIIGVHKPAVIKLGEDQDVYEFNGHNYVVGKEALSCDDKKYTRNIEYILEFAPLLVAHACAKAGVPKNGEVHILKVGLPLKEFRDYRGVLAGKLTSFTVNGYEYRFDVRVQAQGVGVLADYISSQRPEPVENGYILDLGFNTMIVLHYEELRAKSEGSAQWDQWGISRAMEDLQKVIQRDHGLQLNSLEANEVLMTGVLRAGYGKKIDMCPQIEAAVSNYLDSLLKRVENEYDRYLQRADRLVIAGGGANLIRKHLPAKYREFVHIPETPEFANVRGYAVL